MPKPNESPGPYEDEKPEALDLFQRYAELVAPSRQARSNSGMALLHALVQVAQQAGFVTTSSPREIAVVFQPPGSQGSVRVSVKNGDVLIDGKPAPLSWNRRLERFEGPELPVPGQHPPLRRDALAALAEAVLARLPPAKPAP
jgi:hypothetical protein